MSSRPSNEPWLATEIDRLLAQLDAEVPRSMGSDLTRLADRVERRDEDSIANGWPMEVSDAMSAIEGLELAAASELRRLTPSDDRAASFDPRLRANLLLLRRCSRRRRFQELRTSWLANLGEGD